MKLPRPQERDVQAAVLDYLAVRLALPVRTNSGAVKTDGRFIRFNSAPGCADVLACYRGRFLALEIKRDPAAKATPKQNAFLDRVRIAGGVGQVVSSVDQVQAILDRIDSELEASSCP